MPPGAQGSAELEVRSRCAGVAALTARLEPWQVEVCSRPDRLAGWLDQYGSPLNLLETSSMARNTARLQGAARRCDVGLGVFFARKANKALAFVDEARRLGLGVDVASLRELQQALARHVRAADLVVTAAVKPRPLLEACVAAGATVVIDNEDELRLLHRLASGSGRRMPIAFRLAPLLAERPPSRFGLGGAEILELARTYCPPNDESELTIDGVHFHLDGYDAGERVSALGQSLELVDTLRERGHQPTFIDIGGGVPMSYLDDGAEWERFWREHRSALLGHRRPLTFGGHGLGLHAHAGEIVGRPNLYPYFQETTGSAWLTDVLNGAVDVAGERLTAAAALRARGLKLRCEPGRSLLDGCGMTVARVEFRKRWHDGTWLVGVAMNRTQCRSTSDDFLVDPLLLRPGASGRQRRDAEPIEGYLVGAYCIERELLTWRRLRFDSGVEVGDLMAFPNTAGYLMHILESASHQIPLARNLVLGTGGETSLDPIDAHSDAPAL